MNREAARQPAKLGDTQQIVRYAGKCVSRKVWLPKLIYDGLPYFYLASGIAAFLTTLYIGSWLWAVPHYLLFSVGCVHLAIVIYRRRLEGRRKPDLSE